MQPASDTPEPVRRGRTILARLQDLTRRRPSQGPTDRQLPSDLLDTAAESLDLVRRCAGVASSLRETSALLERTAAGTVSKPAAGPASAEPGVVSSPAAVVEDERRRIARELHDTVGQHLCALRLTLGSAQASNCLAAMRQHLAALETLVAAADAELDRAVFTLHPPALGDQGLVEAVKQHVAAWSSLFGIPVDLLVRGLGEADLPPRVAAAVYRVVQESLTNIAKHAGAGHVGMLLTRRGPCLSLCVEDDGTGFDAAAKPAGGLGLVGMRERIEALGGTLEIESAPGKGTAVLVSVAVHGGAGRMKDPPCAAGAELKAQAGLGVRR